MEQISNAFEADIGRRVCREGLGIVSIVPLTRENRGDPRQPHFLDGVEDTRLVIHENIVPSWISPFDIRKFLFFMDIN